jgi:hypothetical protein
MAKISNILPKERIKAPRADAENRRAIWIDSVLRGHVDKVPGGYIWVEGPQDQVPQQRTHAVDLLVIHLLDTGSSHWSDSYHARLPSETSAARRRPQLTGETRACANTA